MNDKLNPKDVLKKYKLREPSVDLKLRIAAATQGAWGKQTAKTSSVSLPVPIWRWAAGLAAALMVAACGSMVNTLILAPVTDNDRYAVVTEESIENIDLGVDLAIPARLRMGFGTRQPVDVAGFIKMRDAMCRETEGLDDVHGKSGTGPCPGQSWYKLAPVNQGEVCV